MQDQQVRGLELQGPNQMATEWISEYLEFKCFLGPCPQIFPLPKYRCFLPYVLASLSTFFLGGYGCTIEGEGLDIHTSIQTEWGGASLTMNTYVTNVCIYTHNSWSGWACFTYIHSNSGIQSILYVSKADQSWCTASCKHPFWEFKKDTAVMNICQWIIHLR